MGYIEPQVAVELTAIASNPALMSGAGGPGISFKTRKAIREASQEIEPGITNIEVYQPTKLSTTVQVRAVSKATK